MISVALLLVIMVGVTEVFKTTSSVIGTSSAISDSIRGFRTVASAMRNDFEGPTNAGQGAVKTHEMPFLVIRNQEVRSFMDTADASAGAAAMVNRRVDTLAFFAKGSFRRATGQPAGSGTAPEELQANQSGEDAWIWYGHLALPLDPAATPSGMTWLPPGQGDATSNPYNYYAKDWILGRHAILLKPISSAQTSSEMKAFQNSSGDSYEYIDSPFSVSLPLVPVQYNAPLKYSSAYTVLDATCDLGSVLNYPTISLPEASLRARTLDYIPINANWWQFIATNGTTGDDTSYRFHCNPFPARPLETAPGAAIKLSQASPQMLRGVSQFIVEFAGDFDVLPGIDVENSVEGDATSPLRIRWYGMPRDVDNDGSAEDRRVSGLGADSRTDSSSDPFERLNSFTALAADNTYTCVWDPDDPSNTNTRKTSVPTMIRITIEYTSPIGRLATPVRQEFIYALPY